jgi:hypothetical protein
MNRRQHSRRKSSRTKKRLREDIGMGGKIADLLGAAKGTVLVPIRSEQIYELQSRTIKRVRR